MASKTDFPPIRACLFDMDGLLLNTEDLYTEAINRVLHSHGKPDLPWSIKAKLQGRPGPAANEIFHNWAQLPIDQDEYLATYTAHQLELFPTAAPLPGVPELLESLARTGANTPPTARVHVALATSSNTRNFKLKSDHLADLFSVFPPHRRVTGDDTRIPAGRGKPRPDIFLLALQTINDSLPADEPPISPAECLVFEDSVPGVEAGRRAGMRVLWVPHRMLVNEYAGQEDLVLAGRTADGAGADVDPHQLGEVGDGWAEQRASLEDFPYEHYKISVPSA